MCTYKTCEWQAFLQFPHLKFNFYIRQYKMIKHNTSYIVVHCKKIRVILTLPWLAQLHLFRSSL